MGTEIHMGNGMLDALDAIVEEIPADVYGDDEKLRPPVMTISSCLPTASLSVSRFQ